MNDRRGGHRLASHILALVVGLGVLSLAVGWTEEQAPLPGSPESAAPVLESVALSENSGLTRIMLEGTDLPNAKVFRRLDPLRLVLAFPGTGISPNLEAAPNFVLTDSVTLNKVAFFLKDEPPYGAAAWAVLYLTQPLRFDVSNSPDRRTASVQLYQSGISSSPSESGSEAPTLDFSVEPSRLGADIVLRSDGPVTYQTRPAGPNRLILDVKGARPPALPERGSVAEIEGLVSLRWNELSSNGAVARAALELAPGYTCHVASDSTGSSVIVTIAGTAETLASGRTVGAEASTQPPEPSALAPVTELALQSGAQAVPAALTGSAEHVLAFAAPWGGSGMEGVSALPAILEPWAMAPVLSPGAQVPVALAPESAEAPPELAPAVTAVSTAVMGVGPTREGSIAEAGPTPRRGQRSRVVSPGSVSIASLTAMGPVLAPGTGSEGGRAVAAPSAPSDVSPAVAEAAQQPAISPPEPEARPTLPESEPSAPPIAVVPRLQMTAQAPEGTGGGGLGAGTLRRPPGALVQGGQPPAPGQIGLDFRNTALADAIAAIAYYGDANIVVDDVVQGNISLTMSDVTVDEALRIICGIKQLAYAKVGDTYVVSTSDRIATVLAATDRVVKTYAPQTKELDNLTKFVQKLHPRVLISFQMDTGLVVVAGNAEDVDAAIDTLQHADVGGMVPSVGALPPGVKQIQVYQMSSGDPAQMVELIGKLVPDVQAIVRTGTMQLILQGPSSKVQAALDLLAKLEAAGGGTRTAVFTPTELDVEAVQGALKQVYKQLAVTPSADKLSLMITGLAAEVDAAVSYAQNMDRGGRPAAERTEIYAVQHVGARGLAYLVQRSFPDVLVQAQPDLQRLVLSGTSDGVQAALDTIPQWDAAEPMGAVRRTITLKRMSPEEAVQVVRDLNLGIDASAVGQALVLEGTPVAVAEAESVVAEMEKPGVAPPTEEPVQYVYEVNYADVRWAAGTVAAALGGQLAGTTFQGVRTVGGGGGAQAVATLTQAQALGIARELRQPGVPGMAPPITVPAPLGPYRVPVPFPGAPTVPGVPGEAEAVPGVPGIYPGMPWFPEEMVPEFAPLAAPLLPGISYTPNWLVIAVDEPSHRIVLTGPRGLVQRARAILEKMDVPRSQVTFDVLITDVSRADQLFRGIKWNFGTLEFQERGLIGGFVSGPGFGILDKRALHLTGLIDLQEIQSRSKLLANPSIQCLDGKKARIQVGDTLRFQIVQFTAVGSPPIFTVETADIGVILEVTPRITQDGYVESELFAESSFISNFIGGLPQVATRNVRTTVRLADAQTMVIGGLIREEDIHIETGVPILKDLPFFGKFFRHREDRKNPQELIIFLTPHIHYAQLGMAPTSSEKAEF